ncbi:MAG TPA: zf-HC2 domain-containing protein [Chthonomonadaceae bacterium]|nr:zf-HC2 domain-containing protein [Chthonomonadaceae bacterium]
MTCAEIQTRLTALYDGELEPEPARRLQAHLETCADCARIAGEIRALRAQAMAWNVADGTVWDAVQAKIEAEEVRTVLAELQRLRTEVRQLRAEVAALRDQQRQGFSEQGNRPSPLLPYAPNEKTTGTRLLM